jgi:urease alpha subunit
MTHHDSSMAACIDACLNCHRTCLETIPHCLSKGGEHAASEHLTLLMVCADICRTSAGAMLLGVEVHHHTCRACAEICKACGDACAAMSADDQAMKRCGDACLKCADSCRQMAA